MSVTFTEEQLRLVLGRLDLVRIELFKLRAMLLPEEELSEEEKKELAEAKKEIAEGLSVRLEDFFKETENSRLKLLFQVIVSRRA
ncbi:MAG: hypothetical protein LM590_13810 [Thermofilum sp.]|jgi:hypothetical protein|nr:hypothetical protein [Thermofilum sp.]